MATATEPALRVPPVLAREPDSLAATAAALEAQRRRAIASSGATILALIACLPVAAAPLLGLSWASVELAPGVPEPALRALGSWLLTSLPAGPLSGLLFAWCAAWLGGGAIAFRRYSLAPRAAYVREYKQRVYAAACRAHFPGIRYEPEAGIPWRVVDESGLFPFASDVYWSEDRFTGRWGATDVCFAEAVAQREERRGFGKERETVHVTYFRGIVFIADFNKHFHSTTRLLPRDESGTRAAGDARVALEDPRFEAVFETWSTDPTDARYVLSLSLMERLTALAERNPGLRARFHAERLLLLLPSARDRFEPDLTRSAEDLGQVAQFGAEVSSCLEVVGALNLDTRIWTKR
jgi:hypothetical protein